MPFIRETVVVTLQSDGSPHIAPLGVIEEPPHLVLAPFRPSRTLDNLRRTGTATINHVTDVRIIAGCVCRRNIDWPTLPAERIRGHRLGAALSHLEVEVVRLEENEIRPRFHCRSVHFAHHRPFEGFNRAQAAVVEAAILISRLHLLPLGEIEENFARLRIPVEKTAGEREREAWSWLEAELHRHRHARTRTGG